MMTFIVPALYVICGLLLWHAGNRIERKRAQYAETLKAIQVEREVMEAAKQMVIDLLSREDPLHPVTVTVPVGPLARIAAQAEREKLEVQKQEIVGRYMKRGNRLRRLGRK